MKKTTDARGQVKRVHQLLVEINYYSECALDAFNKSPEITGKCCARITDRATELHNIMTREDHP